MTMKLGVDLPLSGRGASPESISAVALEAERIGLDSVWSWERLLRPTVPIAMRARRAGDGRAGGLRDGLRPARDPRVRRGPHQPDHPGRERAGRAVPESGRARAPLGDARPPV